MNEHFEMTRVHKLNHMQEISKGAPLELTIKLAVLVPVSSNLLFPLEVFDVDDLIRLRHRDINSGRFV